MKKLVVASVLLIASAGLALAQPAGGGQGRGPGGPGGGRGGAMRQACGADITKLCADKQGRDVRDCLTTNKAKTSKACQAALNAPRPAGGPGGAPGGAMTGPTAKPAGGAMTGPTAKPAAKPAATP